MSYRAILLACFFVLFSATSLFAQGVQPSGSGTVNDPYLIASLSNLEWMGLNDSTWSCYFEQTADIDASATSTWNGGEGWLPIGNDSLYFSGCYDGAGYTIENLFIDRNSEYQGFFGYTSYACIDGVSLLQADITGEDYVASLVGFAEYTEIVRCSSKSSFITGYDDILGGLVGYASYCGVSYSWAECAVQGNIGASIFVGGFVGCGSYSDFLCCYSQSIEEDWDVVGQTHVGGFIGYSINSTTVQRCFSTCSVSGSGYQANTGGFAGTVSGGAITDCYSRGAALGNYQGLGLGAYRVGGFSGYVFNSADIDNCYSTGSALCYSSACGFSTALYDSSIDNCFWDTTTSGITSSVGGTGKTTAQMKDIATFTDETTTGLDDAWDFIGTPNDDTGTNDYWGIDPTVNDGYPYLTELNLLPPESIWMNCYDDPEGVIKWRSVENAETYSVYSVCDSITGTWSLEQDGITDTTWTDTAIASHSLKYYYVVANHMGLTSARSDTVSYYSFPCRPGYTPFSLPYTFHTPYGVVTQNPKDIVGEFMTPGWPYLADQIMDITNAAYCYIDNSGQLAGVLDTLLYSSGFYFKNQNDSTTVYLSGVVEPDSVNYGTLGVGFTVVGIKAGTPIPVSDLDLLSCGFTGGLPYTSDKIWDLTSSQTCYYSTITSSWVGFQYIQPGHCYYIQVKNTPFTWIYNPND